MIQYTYNDMMFLKVRTQTYMSVCSTADDTLISIDLHQSQSCGPLGAFLLSQWVSGSVGHVDQLQRVLAALMAGHVGRFLKKPQLLEEQL